MALLQIAEPGQSPKPHERRLAVGIDLGTTNSLVASVRSGVAEPLKDAQGEVILPSAVHYREADELGFVDKVFVLRERGSGERLGIVVYAHPPLELALRNRATLNMRRDK